MECGVACVHHTGIIKMHLWSADNLDTQLQVRMMASVHSESDLQGFPVV